MSIYRNIITGVGDRGYVILAVYMYRTSPTKNASTRKLLPKSISVPICVSEYFTQRPCTGTLLRSTKETIKMYVYVKYRCPGNSDVQYKQRCKK